MSIHIHNEEEFAHYLETAKEQKLPIIIKFGAKWCGPCNQIAPQFDQLARNSAGDVYMLSVDIDEVPDAATTFSVTNLPTFTLVVDMVTKATIIGANLPKLRQLVYKATMNDKSNTQLE